MLLNQLMHESHLCHLRRDSKPQGTDGSDALVGVNLGGAGWVVASKKRPDGFSWDFLWFMVQGGAQK